MENQGSGGKIKTVDPKTDRQTDKGTFTYTYRKVMSKARFRYVLATNAG